MIDVHNFDQSDQQFVLDFSSPSIEDPSRSKLARLYAANEHSSGAGSEKDAHEHFVTNDDTICPSGHVFVKDKTLPTNITHIPNRSIPKVVHFFVKSKCLPQDVALNVNQWMSLGDHSVLLHDYNEITDYLSKKRNDLPFVWKALNCAFQHETILDLARLVWLHDHGGISVDIDHIPGDGFLNGKLLDPDDKGTARQFIIEDTESHPYTRFIASEPKHFAIYGSLILSVAMQYRQHVFNSTAYSNYTDMRQEIYRHTVNYEFMGRDYKQVIRTMRSKKETIGIINSKRTAGKLLIQTPLTDEALASTRFSNKKDVKICVDLNNDSYHVDTEALLNIIGHISDDGDGENMHHAKCPDGQAYVNSTYVPNSFNIAKRKIPKVVHMTSKSNCFTKPYASNADLWRLEDYSFMMHDDAAVERLFRHSEWSEFPLLKEILPCLTSGAMKADYWRYLVIWAFGGVYTDMDNAPGLQFKNGTIITDEIDAFFEVERSEVASQYFFARKFNCTFYILSILIYQTNPQSHLYYTLHVLHEILHLVSPHHPLAYFMMSATMERIITMARELNKQKQAAEITGPAAVKVAMMANVGNGYPVEGNYTGISNRTVTVVGDKRTAKQHAYIIRQSIKSFSDELKKMNMTHYKNKGESNGMPNHSCKFEMNKISSQS